MLLVLIAAGAAAATTPDIAPAMTLGRDIVITAQLADPALERSYAAQTLTATDLDRAAGTRVDDILAQVPGFQLFRRASSRVANPTTQGLTLRALGGNAASRVAVLLDGVPQEDPFASWIAFSSLLPGDLATVQVVRGGGSVVAGPGALAGSILLTSAVPDATGGSGSVSLGSFDTMALDAKVAVRGERWSAALSAGSYDSAGYRLVPAAQAGPADIPARARARTARLRTSIAVSDDSSLSAAFAAFDERKLAGFANAPNRNDGLDASLRFVRAGDPDAWSVAATSWWKRRNFANVAAAAAPGRATAAVTLDQYDVPGTGWGASAELRPPAWGPLTLRAGGDARWAQGETREYFRAVAGQLTRARRAGGHSRTLGGFAELAWEPSDALLLSAGGRIDQWQLTQGRRTETDRATGLTTLARVFPDRRQTLMTARAAGRWRATPALALRAASYLGWRPATLNELYRPFRVGNDVTEANAALAPERLAGIDIGLDYAPLDGFALNITLFVNRLRDGIANVTIGTGPGIFGDAGFIPAGGSARQRRNIGTIRSRGVEARSTARLARGLSAEASYSYADARAPDARRLAQAPAHQAYGQLRYASPDETWGADVSLRHVSSAFEDDLNTRQLGAATTLAASAYLQLAPQLRLRASIENATNTVVVSAIAGDGTLTRAQPRSITVDVTATF